MAEENKFHIDFQSVEVTDLETGQAVHDDDVAAKGLHAVSQAIEAAGGVVSIPETGLPWADELKPESE
jgi:hypothetical protein